MKIIDTARKSLLLLTIAGAALALHAPAFAQPDGSEPQTPPAATVPAQTMPQTLPVQHQDGVGTPVQPAAEQPETPVVLNNEGDIPRLPGSVDVDQPSLLGSYLAGRIARGLRDHDAAAKYFGQALGLDPDSDVLLEQAFVLELSRGNWKRSTELADEVIKKGEQNRFARMVKGLQAVIARDYATAANEFSHGEQRSPLGKMIGIIVDAWLDLAQGDSQKALNRLHRLDSMSWAKFYQDYHSALIADQAGKSSVADKIYGRLFEKDPRSLRMMDAYVRHLVASGQTQKALDLIKLHEQRNGEHPLIVDLSQRIKAGEKLALIAVTPQDGLAELYYGIGDALTGDGGVDLGMIYLQAGLLLRPDLPLASLALAEAYEETTHFDQANLIYEAIDKKSPLWPNAAVRRAFNLNSLEKPDEAKQALDELLAAYPKDLNALEAQGNILRAHKRYDEAVDYYSRAISLLDRQQKQNWKYYYSRGVCYERLKQWPKAEADLEQARALDADQPLVLNYLGYSWVDQGLHLSTAIRLIRRAVELKPDDGYFVDSLGWAHYRLGNYDKATDELERAVELKPDDPVINDHLGDVYWRVGRRLEAQFQWSQALTLEPEADEIPKIKEKLAKGLGAAEPPRQVNADSIGKKMKDAAGVAGQVLDEAHGKSIGETREHVLRSGESLWLVSKRYYGDGRYHWYLDKVNRGLLRDAYDHVLPGQKLVIPPLPKR